MTPDELNGGPFHEGERAAQAKAGVSPAGTGIRDYMPDQHRSFFALLRYLLVATTDAEGWPVATMLTGAPGFVSSPDPRTLRIAATADAEDPVRPRLRPGARIGVLGIDLSTRRRNRANGSIAAAGPDGITVTVEQSFGNCAQYIQGREVAETAPRAGAPTEFLDGIDASARALIGAADTFFVASTGGGAGVDISHRGGRPGFVRVEGDSLLVPDFRGNRYFNTIGNFLLDPRAALLFVDFSRGDLLQLRANVEVLWHVDEAARPAGAERLWRARITGGWRRRGALPLNWSFRDYAPTTERTGDWPA